MLVSKTELINSKLSGVKVDDLKELAKSLGLESKVKSSELIKSLIKIPEEKIDSFIKKK